MIPTTNANARSRRMAAGFAVACLWLSACHQSMPAAGDGAASAGSAAKAAAAEGVSLTPEQIDKLGLVVQPAQSIQYTEETPGYGIVIGHDIVAQAAADWVTARATARLSRSALARAEKLSGTPGAVSADAEETAAQKAEIDAAAQTAADQKLSSILGMNPPWNSADRDASLQALANGRIKLVRATFPLGALAEGTPTSLRARRIGTSHASGWKMTSIWEAPADASVPGRSFFALLKGGASDRRRAPATMGSDRRIRVRRGGTRRRRRDERRQVLVFREVDAWYFRQDANRRRQARSRGLLRHRRGEGRK